MTSVLTFARESSIGFKAKRLRISKLLTRQELASMAGVSVEKVDLFEHNLPLSLDTRRKILRELWAQRASK